MSGVLLRRDDRICLGARDRVIEIPVERMNHEIRGERRERLGYQARDGDCDLVPRNDAVVVGVDGVEPAELLPERY